MKRQLRLHRASSRICAFAAQFQINHRVGHSFSRHYGDRINDCGWYVVLLLETPNTEPNGALQPVDFDSFYSTSYDRVRRAMTLAFRDPALAEEITQEAFFQTLKRWPKVSELDHPEGWTMVVALNKGRDLHRRRVRHDAKQALLVRQPDAQSSE